MSSPNACKSLLRFSVGIISALVTLSSSQWAVCLVICIQQHCFLTLSFSDQYTSLWNAVLSHLWSKQNPVPPSFSTFRSTRRVRELRTQSKPSCWLILVRERCRSQPSFSLGGTQCIFEINAFAYLHLCKEPRRGRPERSRCARFPGYSSRMSNSCPHEEPSEVN